MNYSILLNRTQLAKKPLIKYSEINGRKKDKQRYVS